MIFRSPLTAGALLLGLPLCTCLAVGDIPPNTPVSSLVASAKANLAKGNPNDALIYFDVAINREPDNYLTRFQRGAAYLSLGRNGLAGEDFDAVLSIKPGFESALLQRAKLKSRVADWSAARSDYRAAGAEGEKSLAELDEAETAARAAFAAEKAKDWEACVVNAGNAVVVAGAALDLRKLRARCRFERGEVLEGVSDLQHVLQLAPGSVDPHLQMSAMLFYSLGDTEKGLTSIKQCLHSDPESKPCKKLHRQEKRIDKQLKKIAELKKKRQFNAAVKILVGDGAEELGLLNDVKDDITACKTDKTFHPSSPNDFYARLLEMTCDFYNEMNNKKKAAPICEEALQLNPDSLPALLFKAQKQLDNEDYEPAIHTLNHAKEKHSGSDQINSLLQKAHERLRRSKTKDYYKVLEVSNDADERTIKRAHRRLIKMFHPDKAVSQGITKEEAEKKTVAINEAYEVLSDPNKRAMVDRGQDPNSQENQGSPFQGSPFEGQQFVFQSGGGGQRFFQQGGPAFQFPGGFQFGHM